MFISANNIDLGKHCWKSEKVGAVLQGWFLLLFASTLVNSNDTYFKCGDAYLIYLMDVSKTHSRPDSVEGLVPRRQEVLTWSPAERIFLRTWCKSMHLVHLGWYTLSCNFFVQGFFLQGKGKVFRDSSWRQHHSSEWLFPSWHCVDPLICFFSLLFSFSKFELYFNSTPESLLCI